MTPVDEYELSLSHLRYPLVLSLSLSLSILLLSVRLCAGSCVCVCVCVRVCIGVSVRACVSWVSRLLRLTKRPMLPSDASIREDATKATAATPVSAAEAHSRGKLYLYRGQGQDAEMVESEHEEFGAGRM